MASLDKRTSSKGKTSYRVRWREGGTRDGEWQSATFTRERPARDFKARVEAAGHRWPDDTTGADSIPGTITVAALAEEYLEDRIKRVRSDRTSADYRRDVDKWILPTFGHRQAGDISEADVQAWVDGLTDKLAAKSINDKHALLASMYKFGLSPSRKHVRHNPCETTDLPKRQKKPPKALTPAEWAALLPALRLIDTDAADLAQFLLASGWRWSEAAALSTFDVEDYGDQGPLYVTMGHVVRRNAAGQHVIVEEGKGEASLRRTRLPATAAEVVRGRLRTAPHGGLVFRTGINRQNGLGGSQWHYSNFKRRYWDKAVKAANLSRKPTPHWLRHTAVVWLHNAGATMPELQRRIGHANIGTTMGVYGRAIEDVTEEALARFDVMMGAGSRALPAGNGKDPVILAETVPTLSVGRVRLPAAGDEG